MAAVPYVGRGRGASIPVLGRRLPRQLSTRESDGYQADRPERVTGRQGGEAALPCFMHRCEASVGRGPAGARWRELGAARKATCRRRASVDVS